MKRLRFGVPADAFYAFVFATLTSMCLGQLVLYEHRQVHHHGRGRLRRVASRARNAAAAARLGEPKEEEQTGTGGPVVTAGDAACANDEESKADQAAASSKQSASPAVVSSPEELLVVSAAALALAPLYGSLATHRLKGLPARWWQRLVAPLALAVTVLLVVSFTVRIITFELGGALGFAIDVTGGESDASYSAPGLAKALVHATPDDEWRPLVQVLMGVSVLFSCAVPALSVLLVSVIWLAPLSAPSQIQLLALSEVAYGWSSLDVFIVALIATATQLGGIAESLSGEQCQEVDGFLEAFFRQALQGDTTCFRIAVHVLPGCFQLTLACVLHMLLGHLSASVTTQAIAERAAAHVERLKTNDTRLSQRQTFGNGEDESFALELTPRPTQK